MVKSRIQKVEMGDSEYVMILLHFLKFSVLEKGENTRWLALDSTWRRENIIQTNDKENEPKVPLKSQELVTFMNILEKEGKHSFRLVVGLMG